MNDWTAMHPKQKTNYTKEMETEMLERYCAQPCSEIVDNLAFDFNKSRASIIAKLRSLGVYQSKKSTSPPTIKKAQIVSSIELKLGTAMPSLVKANKQDLERLVNALENIV